MPTFTNENNGDIKNKLEYLGLDLDNIPKELKEYEYLDFKLSRNYEDNLYKVYKYIPINKIQILLTPTNRMDTLYEKYSKSSPLYNYLVPEEDDDIIRHTTFLKMLNDVNIEEIKDIEEEQKNFEHNIPFKIKYDDNYLWQIYYSEETEKYFMLVPTKEQDTATFFYLLKKKIENKDEQYIFVPINNLQYSRRYITKDQFSDIEKYLWLFTKEWPNIYEVYDKNNKLSIQIVGNTIVYEKIRSFYKIKFYNKDDITKFYTLIKALFILETELPHYYKFEVNISSNGGLDFFYKTKIINYNNLPKIVQEEYIGIYENIKILKEEEKNKKEELDKLRTTSAQKDIEYIQKEKQIATFLECRKTFLGKVRYFFKKGKNKIQNKKEEKTEIIKENEEIIEEIYEEKEYYTIEDLLKISKDFDKLSINIKNMNLDIDAIKRRIELIDSKIKNANTYIQEIENHKKSIFEFWKFANKDNTLLLNEGNENINSDNQIKLKKVFNYDEDYEEFGTKIDKIQRDSFEKKECDFIYLTNFNDILKDINSLKLNNNVDLDKSLENLKKEAEKEEMLFRSKEYDIFGGILEDKTKINILNNKKHREIKKNKFKILDITKSLTKEEYQESLNRILENLSKSYRKIKLDTDISIYFASDGGINTKEYGVFNINPENALKKCSNSDKINLYRINLKEDMPIIAFSNIIFYDNQNRTLPLGMDITDEVLIDMDVFNIELKRQKLFRINQSIDKINVNTKIICVYEYDVEEKNS